jgi:hypothetical protein
MIRERIVPVLWLLLAAVLIGVSVGLAARANAEPFNPTDIVNPPPQTRTPCLWMGEWLCPEGFTPPAVF